MKKRIIHIATIFLMMSVLVSTIGVDIYHHFCTSTGAHFVTLTRYDCHHTDHDVVVDEGHCHIDKGHSEAQHCCLNSKCCYDIVDRFQLNLPVVIQKISLPEPQSVYATVPMFATELKSAANQITDFADTSPPAPDIEPTYYNISFLSIASLRGLDADLS